MFIFKFKNPNSTIKHSINLISSEQFNFNKLLFNSNSSFLKLFCCSKISFDISIKFSLILSIISKSLILVIVDMFFL